MVKHERCVLHNVPKVRILRCCQLPLCGFVKGHFTYFFICQILQRELLCFEVSGFTRIHLALVSLIPSPEYFSTLLTSPDAFDEAATFNLFLLASRNLVAATSPMNTMYRQRCAVNPCRYLGASLVWKSCGAATAEALDTAVSAETHII